MLNGIKKLIKERKEYMEAASLIMESDELDDSIILLNEGPDEADLDPEFEEDRPDDEEDKDDDKEDKEKEEDEPSSDSKDEPSLEDEPIEEPEEKPMELPGDDELPEPVGRQTGEPATIGDGDILNIEINLASNTQTDTLPIPPAGAGDAIEDNDGDILNQRIDSGFGGEDVSAPVEAEETDDLLDTPVSEGGSDYEARIAVPCKGKKCEDDDEEDEEDEEKEEKCCKENADDLLSEAITLGGDEGSTEDAPTEDAPTEDQAPDVDNAVTAAVKDKVSELKSSDEEILPPDNSGEGSDEGNNNLKDPKSILQRLGKLTTSIENIKNGIINSLNGKQE